MIPEREREALMRLTMCAREECAMCKYKDTCDFDFQFKTATNCMNILADALRKTEPITHDDYIESENDYLEARCLNCANSCSYKCTKCDGKMYFKTEPLDKDTNVRSKYDCETCRYADECDWEPWQECPYAPKTEPQNEYCPTCGQMYPKWIREQNEPKTEPQTERSSE